MSSDQSPALFAAREPVFPRRVTGPFRTAKWWIMAVTLGIYYITPWIRWDRGADMPSQAVLVDLANRRFFFFWIEIWPQEFYYVAGLLIMAGLGLFLFTSALGRVWCGYACPQTVWVDLFILVERWIEGDRNARIRLLKQPWNPDKARKRIMKWTSWLLIGLATGGAWIFYFADAPTLLVDLVTFQAPFVAYTTMLILTATTFVFGGFMREQVCNYMCPWPRIQGAMLDPLSLIVTYRDWRGEPRGKHRKREGAEELGDCIDCNACVAVCPQGIDIRDGQQMECITCALCIDACDDVMDKIGKPRGLIAYATLADEASAAKGEDHPPVWKRAIRPRTLIYFTLWAGIGIAMVVTLFMRDTLDVTVERDRNPVFVTLSDGSIRNGYTLKVQNKQGSRQDIWVFLETGEWLQMEIQDLDGNRVEAPADSQKTLRIFVVSPEGALPNERTDIRFRLENPLTKERVFYKSVFIGPEAGG